MLFSDVYLITMPITDLIETVQSDAL